MRSSGATAYGGAEREIRNVVSGKILAQPDAFRLIGTDRDIDASSMVEAQGTVQCRFSERADRQRLGKFALEGAVHVLEIARGKAAVTIEALWQSMGVGRRAFQLGLVRGFLAGHFGHFMNQFGARHGVIMLFTRPIQFFDQGRQVDPRSYARIHQLPFLRNVQLPLLDTSNRHLCHFVGILLAHVLTVQGATQKGVILSLIQLLLCGI